MKTFENKGQYTFPIARKNPNKIRHIYADRNHTSGFPATNTGPRLSQREMSDSPMSKATL